MNMDIDSILRKWKARMPDDGKVALLDLIKGRGAIAALSPAEPDDVVDTVIRQEDEDSAIVRSLDKGCASLVNDHMPTLFSRRGVDYEIGLYELTALITIIRRVLPERTVVDFHGRYSEWNDFFGNIGADEYFDLRREYFHILAASQESAAKHGALDADQEERWMSVCAESGDSGIYNVNYLRAALLGICRLPREYRSGEVEDLALRGLVIWAVRQFPNMEEFEQQWISLKFILRRDGDFWAERVNKITKSADALPNLSQREGEYWQRISKWWRNDVGIRETA